MTAKKTSAEVIRLYNEFAIAMPSGAWSRKFVHARMDKAGGSGRINLEYQVYVPAVQRWEPDRITISTTDAYVEFSRLKNRYRRYVSSLKKKTL